MGSSLKLVNVRNSTRLGAQRIDLRQKTGSAIGLEDVCGLVRVIVWSS